MATKSQKIYEKKPNIFIAILGMGYVGLPLAVVFTETGINLTGVDQEKRFADSAAK